MSINGYYNRFNPDDHYVKSLYRSGKGLQSAELNEDHEYLRYNLKQIADALFSDGSILKGGSISINTTTNIATCQESIAYANEGYTVLIPSGVVSLVGMGEEVLGFATLEETITEDEDSTLRDPAVGTRNYNEPGAARLKITARWCKQIDLQPEEYFYPIHTIVDSILTTQEVVAPELESTRQLIAKYDYGSNGSYVIDGFTPGFAEDDVVGHEHIMTMSEGEARVEGYSVAFQYAQKVRVPYAEDTREIAGEPKSYTGAGWYDMSFTPIASVIEILGIAQTTESVRKGAGGSADALTNYPVVSIVSVVYGATTYTPGSPGSGDYYLDSNRYVNWSNPGPAIEPPPDVYYDVTYQYTSQPTATVHTNRTQLYVDNLAVGTTFFVDYTYYLPRIDRIYLLKDGDFAVVKGVPDDLNPIPPESAIGLQLAQIHVVYGEDPIYTPDYFRAYKMSDIKNLFDKMAELQYNLARLSLTEDARAYDPTSIKKNIFVDPFFDDDLRDIGSGVDNAIIAEKVLRPNVDWSIFNVRNGSPITKAYTPEATITQDSYSKSRQINELTWTSAPPGHITLEPSRYSWMSREISRSFEEWSWWWGGGSETSTSISDQNVTAEIPQININIQGGIFNAGESVEIWFDQKLVTTINADGLGMLNNTFQIPTGVMSGSKLVECVGTVTGVRASNTFTAQPFERTVTTIRRRFQIWNDPLAQTFTLEEDNFIHSLQILCTTAPIEFIDVLVCETQVGIPDRNKAIAVKRLFPGDITLGSWTEFTFDDLVFCQRNVEYAFVVECTDSTAEVRVAELGKWDIAKNRWITSQTYDVGVMLQSANGSTWSPIQTEDLAFIMSRKTFTTTPEEVNLGTISVTNATDLLLMVGVDNFPNTSASFTATINRGGGDEIISIKPYVPVEVDTYTGDVTIKVNISSSDDRYTPVIEGDIQMAVGLLDVPSIYTSRFFNVDGTDIKVYIDLQEPTAATISLEYWTGTVWASLTRGSSTPLDEGWSEVLFSVTGLSISESRIRINMTTADVTQRPYSRNLRALVI